jgi:hypothetical protein
MDQAVTDKVLFFIPDISGFTKFVSETEISHSQHVIKGLLEVLVDSNTIGLKVSEFEGDAILFYRHGAPPPLGDFVEQARRMFVGFHTLLKKIELSRICQCGACAGASGLTLKIVAHLGPAGELKVKEQSKFIGTGIIVAHRLLKNSVPEREYLLLTRELLGLSGNAGGDPGLFMDGVDRYDEIGDVPYQYMSLGRFREEVKVQPPEPFVVKNPCTVMEVSRRIDAPAAVVFETLTDLPGRMKWVDGIRRVELHDDRPNRIGAVHRCVLSGGDLDLVTSDVRITDQTMEYAETDIRRMTSCRYLLQKTPAGGTDLAMQFLVRGNFVVKLMFKTFREKKLRAGFEKSLANLAALCEQSGRPAPV